MNTQQLERGKQLVKMIEIASEAESDLENMIAEHDADNKDRRSRGQEINDHNNNDYYGLHISECKDGSDGPITLTGLPAFNERLLTIALRELRSYLKELRSEFENL